jgi:hypothetical protein
MAFFLNGFLGMAYPPQLLLLDFFCLDWTKFSIS